MGLLKKQSKTSFIRDTSGRVISTIRSGDIPLGGSYSFEDKVLKHERKEREQRARKKRQKRKIRTKKIRRAQKKMDTWSRQLDRMFKDMGMP